ncbi:MAG: acyl-CoA dehydrogenase [Rhodospirillaceae bacterium]|nr:acyl-CoA dehydrogenase [Rhodospirillaceae bacterium]MBT5242822.1 acyl-CoA dehydrogenase [Rhodospirillaceae bacterium]MBT5564023.1 acyl-CoA dehydrogenase [Rhodospirillaceae bacterium]MBT6243298.1 acyl-CoA dehydrogenase [Rhodospirillaceae bacterium]MBT7137593.1 acyl-CoA dehydrogenase [Rhodospirillaceae bacterium]
MALQLNDEQRMLVESLRAFVAQEIEPHEAEVDRTGEVPEELGAQITKRALEMGFYAANLPESVGGGGLDYVSLALLERVFGRSSFGLHGYCHRPSEILMACEGDQIETYLKPCVSAEKKELFALTEPGAGSDIMSMKTRAVADGDDYVINGSKHFISSVGIPDFAIVFAQTGVDETPRGERKRVTAFLVDADTKGFDMVRGSRCAAQRAYNHFELSFDDCRVSKDHILGEEGKGLDLADKWLSMGRVWVAAGCCGRMERLLELATEWAATRVQFGQPIGKFQGTSFKLADMATDLHAADLMVMHAAKKADEGQMDPQDAAMTKLFASEAVGRAADSTVQIYGGMGLMEELPVERLWRDARLDRIWDGTSEIQRHIIARSLLRPLGV